MQPHAVYMLVRHDWEPYETTHGFAEVRKLVGDYDEDVPLAKQLFSFVADSTIHCEYAGVKVVRARPSTSVVEVFLVLWVTLSLHAHFLAIEQVSVDSGAER